MATAASTFTWEDYGTLLKTFLGISGSGEDTQLNAWLAAAAADCDEYCGWYFEDEDGETVDETPTDPGTLPLIRLGIYEWVKTARALHSSPGAVGLSSVKTGQLQENYQGGGLTLINLARAAAYPLWAPHVYNLLRAGASQ